jgi:hypothetical protein
LPQSDSCNVLFQNSRKLSWKARHSRAKFRGAYDSDPDMAAFAAQYEAAWDDLLARVIVTRGEG